MVTLEETLRASHDWVIDRIHYLTERDLERDPLMEDAHALRCEFDEWLNPNIKDHDIVSLEFIGDDE